jgi:hypothetical protein
VRSDESKKKSVICDIITAIVFVGLLVLFSVLKSDQSVAENTLVRKISRTYVYAVGNITSLLPFALFEVFVIAAVIALITIIVVYVVLLKKRKFKTLGRSALKVICAVLGLLLIYTATATVCYPRVPAINALPHEAQTQELDIIKATVEYYLDDFNALSKRLPRKDSGEVINPYTTAELSDKLKEEYKRLEDNDYFSPFTPTLKEPPILSYVLAYQGIIGISFVPTAEPNISALMPDIDKPNTAAHEIAHSKGVMYESDANLVAAYITVFSDDDYIRYSGYMNNFWEVLNLFKLYGEPELYNEYRGKVCDEIWTDIEIRREKYAEYDTFIEHIGEKMNDLYLKISGANDGVKSYTSPGSSTDVLDGNGNPVLGEDGKPLKTVKYGIIQQLLLGCYLNTFPL